MHRINTCLGLAGVAVMLVLPSACTDNSGPNAPVVNQVPALVVSAPVSPNAGAQAAVAGTIAYVSMPPASVPQGIRVAIRNAATGATATAAMVNGGFDPVAIAASAGDTIFTTITQTSAGSPLSGYQVVSIRRPPSVVRTSPPARKADVPINATILVVFSSAMDSASVDRAITLSAGGIQIAGTVTTPQRPGDVLTATFVPAAPLSLGTAYEVDIAATARDMSGAALEAPLQTTFTTAGGPPTISIIGPLPGDSMPVDYMNVSAHVSTANGIASMSVWLFDSASGSMLPLESESGYFYNRSGDGWFKMASRLTPGAHNLKFEVLDSANQMAVSAPITLVTARPDTVPRITVRSFSVLEVSWDGTGQSWEYAPQLVVSDTLGSGPLQILGLEVLDIPGLQAPFPRAWAVDLAVPAAEDTPLFREVYGDFDLAFSASDGHRATGGTATARLTYRDRLGGLHEKTISGPIVSGHWPGTYSGGCGHWRGWGFEFDNCTSGLSLMVGGSRSTGSANARRPRPTRRSP